MRIRAVNIFTGPDGHTKVITGTLAENLLTEANSLRFKTTPPHGSYDWHPAPTTQYVITISGTLEFQTFTGETFIIKPGDVLIAQDTTGSGHKWRLLGDQPWIRAYIAFNSGTPLNFIPDSSD
jgi:quercetin dioxygenase-like cupin family protein